MATTIGINFQLNGLQQTTSAIQQASAQASAAAAQHAAASTTAAQQSTAAQLATHRRLAQARERLGIRSDHVIQQEIRRTQAAYERLARSGKLSFQEQARAADAARQRVAQLTNEMGRLTARQKAASAVKIGVAGVAGLGAAAAAVKDPVQRVIDYDYRLAHMANTAFAERDTEGRKLGMKELETAINNAVIQGGGTRDSAAEALDKIVASGAVSTGDAIKILPQIVKAATASNSDAGELADIAIRAMQSFNITAKEIPNVLNQAIAAGQAGGFELKDMARWLPRQLAMASASGLSGRSDFAALAALNQAAAITAGTRDEAGNNVANLLAKINSKDTAARVKKVMGIDLGKYLQDARAKGSNSIDAFASLVTKSVEKNPKYRDLQKQLASAKDDEERKTTLRSMAAIAQGSAIGQLVPDQQAMMALLALINNQGYMQDVRQQVLENDVASGGAVDKNMELLSGTASYKIAQGRELTEIGKKKKIDELMPTITDAAEAYRQFASEHTEFVGGAALATEALTALAAAAGLATIAMGGRGIGGGIGGRLGGGISRIGGRVLSGATAIGSSAARALAIPLAKLAAAGAVGYGTGTLIERGATKLAEGTRMEGVGPTYIGGAVARILAFFGNEEAQRTLALNEEYSEDRRQTLEDELAALRAYNASLAAENAQPVDINANLQIGLGPGLVVMRQDVNTSGNGNIKMSTGNLATGAP